MSEQTPLSDWTHATAEIPDRGLTRERAASEAERSEIARALKLISLDKLVAAYRIEPLPKAIGVVACQRCLHRQGAAASITGGIPGQQMPLPRMVCRSQLVNPTGRTRTDAMQQRLEGVNDR